MLTSLTRLIGISLASVFATTTLVVSSPRSLVPTMNAARALAEVRPAVILVHGAFADASSWGRVIALLQRDGFRVTAVQNSLASLDADIATTKRVIDAESKNGPVVVVGHSYGGAVITGAASGNANVKSLVYVAAFAPDSGETVGALSGKFGDAPLAQALAPDAGGYLYINREKFRDVFCADVGMKESDVMATTQKPWGLPALGGTIVRPAWRTIPSWYLVSANDRAIKPELERFFARRMGAHTSEVDASHVAFISQPEVVTRLIEEAAGVALGRKLGPSQRDPALHRSPSR